MLRRTHINGKESSVKFFMLFLFSLQETTQGLLGRGVDPSNLQHDFNRLRDMGKE